MPYICALLLQNLHIEKIQFQNLINYIDSSAKITYVIFGNSNVNNEMYLPSLNTKDDDDKFNSTYANKEVHLKLRQINFLRQFNTTNY